MAANTVPIFTKTPNVGVVNIFTAELDLDNPTASAVVFTAAADGSVLKRIRVKGIGASTTAGLIHIWLVRSSVYYLYKQIVVTAATPSATVASFEATETLNLYLASGDTVEVACSKNEDFDVTAEGEDY